jgi:hypothetical protein
VSGCIIVKAVKLATKLDHRSILLSVSNNFWNQRSSLKLPNNQLQLEELEPDHNLKHSASYSLS